MEVTKLGDLLELAYEGLKAEDRRDGNVRLWLKWSDWLA